VDFFTYRDGELYCEDVPVRSIADETGSPVYIYSRRTIIHHYDRLAEAFPPSDCLICYSVKANSNLAVLKALQEQGSGFDVVSLGELKRVLQVGGDPGKVIFSGVGKTEEEIRGAVRAGILMINVESAEEMAEVDRIARDEEQVAGVAIRLNPDVDPETHEYITTGKEENKFGIPIREALDLARKVDSMPGVRLLGLHLHIGSQITKVDPYLESLRKGIRLAEKLSIRYFNIGGGFGIHYREGEAKDAAEFGRAILPEIPKKGWTVVLEPGRFIVGNAGVLVVRALYRKQTGRRRFVVTDGGMNDLIRPSLYGSFHRISPVTPAPGDRDSVDVVGPICESADFLGKDRPLPPVEPGDLLAVFSAGAYAFAMASNYNSRPRPPEVMVDGSDWRIIRRRETYQDLIRGESV
jgi:diaminopimelate decarboxylase